MDANHFSVSSINGKADSRIASSQTMDLVEDDAAAFDQIFNWLYHENLNSGVDKVCPPLRICQIYATAEKYGMVNLKNHIVGRIMRTAKNERIIPHLDVVKYVYSTTPSNSPLRRLFVALYIWHVDKKYWASRVTSASLSEIPDFAADLAIVLGSKSFANRMERPPEFPGKLEDYHEKPVSMKGQERKESPTAQKST